MLINRQLGEKLSLGRLHPRYKPISQSYHKYISWFFSSLDKEHFDRNPYTCKCTYKWGILLISSVLNFNYYSISQISRSSEQITCVIYHLQFTISSITGPYGFYTDRRYLMMNSGYLWIYLDIYIYMIWWILCTVFLWEREPASGPWLMGYTRWTLDSW